MWICRENWTGTGDRKYTDYILYAKKPSKNSYISGMWQSEEGNDIRGELCSIRVHELTKIRLRPGQGPVEVQLVRV